MGLFLVKDTTSTRGSTYNSSTTTANTMTATVYPQGQSLAKKGVGVFN